MKRPQNLKTSVGRAEAIVGKVREVRLSSGRFSTLLVQDKDDDIIDVQVLTELIRDVDRLELENSQIIVASRSVTYYYESDGESLYQDTDLIHFLDGPLSGQTKVRQDSPG